MRVQRNVIPHPRSQSGTGLHDAGSSPLGIISLLLDPRTTGIAICIYSSTRGQIGNTKVLRFVFNRFTLEQNGSLRGDDKTDTLESFFTTLNLLKTKVFY